MEEKVKEIVEIKQRSLAEENQKTLEVLKEREQSLQCHKMSIIRGFAEYFGNTFHHSGCAGRYTKLLGTSGILFWNETLCCVAR